MNDLSKRIADALSSFPHGDLLQRTKHLLNILGYASDKTFSRFSSGSSRRRG